MVYTAELRPGRPRNNKASNFDKALELKGTSAALTATTVSAGVQFPARQQKDYKAVINFSSTLLGSGSSDSSWTIAVQVATNAATGTTGTTVETFTVPSPAAASTLAGTRELYLGGASVEGAVGSIAALADPIFLRVSATKGGTSSGSLSYTAFLTIAT